MSKRFFTSESVTEGHPDKLCDQVSDAILDAILEKDPMGRVAAETTASTGYVMVMGEITTECNVDIESIVRKVVCDIGYDNAAFCFDGNNCAVLTSVHGQSPDIAMGVDKALEYREGDASEEMDTGAGDQGLMFGYACDETPELMPMPISLAHKLSRKLAEVRKAGILPYLRPDGKTQVTVEYDDELPVRVDTVLISTQHDPDVSGEQIAEDLWKHVVLPVIPAGLLDENSKYLVNPTGRFVIGGPAGDSGLTGRKIIVDTYGGYARHGGGAFSGKDPTKVDRSASYAARWVAKNLVAAGLARRVELQLAYAIGVAHPLSIHIDSFGTGALSDEKLEELVRTCFDLRPAAIIRDLDLRRPIYRATTNYGHFGREDMGFPWERTDRAEALKKAAAALK